MPLELLLNPLVLLGALDNLSESLPTRRGVRLASGPTDDRHRILGASKSISFFVMKKLLGIDSWAISLPFDILIMLVDCFLGFLQLRELLRVGLVVVLAHPPRYCDDQLPGLRVPAILGQPPPDGARVENLVPITISSDFSPDPRKTKWSHTESSFPRAPQPTRRVRH